MTLNRLLMALATLAPASAALAKTQPILVPETPIELAPATQPTTEPTTQAATQPVDALPRSLQLKSGERVTGVITSRTADAITIDSQTLGTVTLKRDLIDQVIGADGKPEGFVEPPPPVDRGLFKTGIFSGWTRQFEAGLTGTSGTSDSLALDAQFSASTDNPRYRATLSAFYFFTHDGGAITRNQSRVLGTVDKRIHGGPWFIFGRGQYDNDSLQNFENRISAFGGPGYEFVRNAKYELLGRVGLGETFEFGGTFADDYDRTRFEALVGIDAKWVIDPTQSIVGSFYYYPTLEDLDYGRFVTTAAYQIDLNASKGIAFKAGIEHTNELRTAGDDEHNNFKFFTNIVFKL